MAAFDDAVLADAPAAYWPLDETTGTVANDASGNGNHGTYVGSPALGSATVEGRTCPDFDGADDYVACPAIALPTTGFSLEVVGRMDSYVNEGTILGERMVDGRSFAAIGTHIGGEGAHGTLSAGGYYGGGNWVTIVDGTWTAGAVHHGVLTHDGTTMRLYVDGVMVGSRAATVLASSNGWDIGAGHSRTTFWNGPIAAAALYPTVLSAERVATHHDALSGVVAPVTAAVSFTATATLGATPAPDVVTEVAAASFTATATLRIGPAVTVEAVRAAVSWRGTAALDVTVAPIGRRRRLVVVGMDGEPVAELENAKVGAVTFSLNEPESFAFTLPADDPKAALLLDVPFAEVQLWRGDQLLAWGPAVRPAADKTSLAVSVKGVAWYLTRRHVGRAGRTSHVVNGDFDDGLAGWEAGALSPFEPLANTAPEHFDADVTTDRTLTGRHALRLAQPVSGTPRYGVSASQFFVWDVDPDLGREGDQWTLTAYCYLPADAWAGPPPEPTGVTLARYSTTETVDIRRDDGSPPVAYPKPIEAASVAIDDTTPRDTWVRLEATLRSPVTGQPEFVQVTLGCPVGVVYWDRVGLTLDEALRFYAVDQADIVADVVGHLQDPAYGKSDLNLATDTPATGVRRDRTYLHHEHASGAEILDEFTTLDDGLDLSIAYTATTRTLRTHHPARGRHRPTHSLELGRNVADFAWTFDGENAADAVIVLGTGDGSEREEAFAVDTTRYAGGVTVETVYTAPPGTPIDSLDEVAAETLNTTVTPDLLTVTTTPAQPGQPDPVGVLAPGDTVPVRLGAGAVTVAGTYRVVQLTVNPDDSLDLTLNRRGP